MNKERLEKILHSHESIEKVKWIKEDKYGFSRTVEFYVRGVRYEIVWFCNCSSLFCGELEVCSFETLEVDGCWPNGFKENLVFGLKDDSFISGRRTIAVIPLEEYKR